MPTYGYRCTSCGTEFDVWQRMSDPAGASCPACGKPARRLFFAPAIVFNGSGFYKTDSREVSKAGASNGKSSKSRADTSSSTESPAATSESTAGAGSGSSVTSASSTPSSSTD